MEIKDKVTVFMDENADYCIIVGTSDRNLAEKFLRETEEEWYGKDYTEKPIPMDDFSAATLYSGEHNSESGYYWGDAPEKYFSEGRYEVESGFIAPLN